MPDQTHPALAEIDREIAETTAMLRHAEAEVERHLYVLTLLQAMRERQAKHLAELPAASPAQHLAALKKPRAPRGSRQAAQDETVLAWFEAYEYDYVALAEILRSIGGRQKDTKDSIDRLVLAGRLVQRELDGLYGLPPTGDAP